MSSLPAWSLSAADAGRIALSAEWPAQVTREWAWGGSTGEGGRVCVVDSGVEPDHPRVGPVQQAVYVRAEDGEAEVLPDEEGDLCGHGTACAGIVRELAPACSRSTARSFSTPSPVTRPARAADAAVSGRLGVPSAGIAAP